MYVTIAAKKYGNCPEYQGAELKVPATKEAIGDAMERARVPAEGEYRMTAFRGWPAFLKERLARMEAEVREVSFLAGQVRRMDPKSLSEYEGVLACREAERGDQGCSMKDLINAAYNLESFDFLPGIVKDTDLGENALDGDYVRILQGLPEEVIELLDAAKVGAYLRQLEKGAFTKEGYCFPSGIGWQEIYDGHDLPEKESKTEVLLSIRIENRGRPEGGDAWLSLPRSEEKLLSVCRKLGAESFRQCRITDVVSLAPILEEQIGPDEDFRALNRLAERLGQMTPKELVKYKAVLEFDRWKSVERSLWLADHLEDYVFDPSQVSYGGYGVIQQIIWRRFRQFIWRQIQVLIV